MYSGGAMIDHIQDSAMTPLRNTPSTTSSNNTLPTNTPPANTPLTKSKMDTPTNPLENASNNTTVQDSSKNTTVQDSSKNTTVQDSSKNTTVQDSSKNTTVDDSSQHTHDETTTRVPPIAHTSPKDDAYAPEYSIFFVIYMIIGLMYLIHSGVDLPTTLNNWLLENPHYINMTLSTLYFALSIVYILYFHPKHESKNGEMYRQIVAIMVVAIIFIGWYKLYRKDTTPRTTMPQSSDQAIGF